MPTWNVTKNVKSNKLHDFPSVTKDLSTFLDIKVSQNSATKTFKFRHL